MKNVRIVMTTVVLVSTAMITVSGCGLVKPGRGVHTVDSATASANPATPKDALVASVGPMTKAAFDFKVKRARLFGSGQVDPAAKSWTLMLGSIDPTVILSYAFVTIDTDYWIKVDLGASANQQAGIQRGTWMHLDRSRITVKDAFPIDATGDGDALGLTSTLQHTAAVTRTDSTSYAGTIDLSVGSPLSPDAETQRRLGYQVAAVPFTATVDSQGRLTDIKVDGSGIEDSLTVELSVADYGAATAITKPASSIPAPAGLYKLFNS